MKPIPKNRKIRSFADLQNVVTSVILRQKGKFTREDIYAGIEANIKFSCYGKYGKKRKEINLEKMIEETWEALSCEGCIKLDLETNKYELDISFPAIPAK